MRLRRTKLPKNSIWEKISSFRKQKMLHKRVFMTILDRYIFKQILYAVLISIITVIVIWISPEILFKIIRNTISGQITLLTAVKLFFLEIPEILGKAIPAGLLIGSLFVFDRLSKDSELTIIRGIGVSVPRLLLPAIILGIIGMVICYFVNIYLVPYSSVVISNLKKEGFVKHFVFVEKYSQNQPKNILIVNRYNGAYAADINYLEFSEPSGDQGGMIKRISNAETAVIKDGYWLIKKGIEYDISSGGVYEKIKKFDRKKALEGKASVDAKNLIIYSSKSVREMTDEKLKSYIEVLKKMGMFEEYNFAINKYYQRFAHSTGCLFFAVCGVLLGFSRPREKRFVGYTFGVVLIFVYYIILPFIDLLAQTQVLNPLLAAWLPNFILLAAIAALIKYKEL